jgi:glutaredoxin
MLLLFTQPGCVQCLISKKKLEDKQLTYKEIDISTSQENLDLAIKYGVKTSGTVIDDATGEQFKLNQ